MADADIPEEVKKITAFSKRFYTLRAITLLKELINIVNNFDHTQQDLKILSKGRGNKIITGYLSSSVLSRVDKFDKRAKQQAEQLLLVLTDGQDPTLTPLEQDYVDRLTFKKNDNNPEKRVEIEQLLNKYALDIADNPAIYTSRLIFDYDPATASPTTSSAFNRNSDTLRKNGLINPLNEATLLYNQSFDVRQLLTFDDYRLYLLHHYFNILRADLSKDDAQQSDTPGRALTPFDLLFNPTLEITYSPQVLAILHFRHQLQLTALTAFISHIKEEARQLLNESGELVYQIDARTNVLRTTLSQLKARQQTIASKLETQMQTISPHSRHHQRPAPQNRGSKQTAKMEEEVRAMKRQRAIITNNTRLLNDYQRIVKLYVDAEKKFLRDLADYLLANKTDGASSQTVSALREQILNDDLAIQENHHQFRVTEKKTDPRFRDKPFEGQNNQYTNYRKLWMDIIDRMFSATEH